VFDASSLLPGTTSLDIDGDKHTITALDPTAGHFLGAILLVTGGVEAKVYDFEITTYALANVCDGGADRLRGIMYEGASGRIENNKLIDINQNASGGSGCQEGNAIEVRNEPFDGTHPNTQKVKIKDNYVERPQKTGIVCNGDVDCQIEKNKVIGQGAIDYIAQNGIQCGFGALCRVRKNDVWGSSYTPATFASACILVFDGQNGKVHVDRNDMHLCDVGVWFISTDDGKVEKNNAEDCVFDCFALDNQAGGTTDGNRLRKNDADAPCGTGQGLYGATNSQVDKNTADGCGIGIALDDSSSGNKVKDNKVENSLGNGMEVAGDSNEIRDNDIEDSSGTGLLVSGDTNTVKKNEVHDSAVLDIDNTGSGNTYADNDCDTSSGPPVDCGTSPTITSLSVGLLSVPVPAPVLPKVSPSM
jgi:parallel beta-helix repeat protein